MHSPKTLSRLAAGLACLAVVGTGVTTSGEYFDDHDHHVEFPWFHCFRDIDHCGNLDKHHFGCAEMKLNTKNWQLQMQSECDEIRNSSCDKYSEHHLPGYYFCFPYYWGLDCHYQVWAKDCDNSHDEKAKLHGKSQHDSNHNDDRVEEA